MHTHLVVTLPDLPTREAATAIRLATKQLQDEDADFKKDFNRNLGTYMLSPRKIRLPERLANRLAAILRGTGHHVHVEPPDVR